MKSLKSRVGFLENKVGNADRQGYLVVRHGEDLDEKLQEYRAAHPDVEHVQIMRIVPIEPPHREVAA